MSAFACCCILQASLLGQNTPLRGEVATWVGVWCVFEHLRVCGEMRLVVRGEARSDEKGERKDHDVMM